MKAPLAAAALFVAAAGAEAQTADQLLYTCRGFVERTLHDPRDAELSGWTSGQAQRRKDGLWVVTFKGRAKNAYGALRLSTFECVIRYDGADNFTGKSVRALP